jgi:hypothetical protein
MKGNLQIASKLECLVVLTILVFLPNLSKATGILYQFNTPFPTDPSPSGSTPWLTADFENTAGGVTLTISAAGLTGSEFASEIYFNIDPNLNQHSLTFSKTAYTGTFSTPTIDQAVGDNNYKADGDGKYDFRFNFGTAHGTTFGSGDSITYQIGGILGLVANNFAFLSAPAGGSGPFYAAAHIQSLGNGGCTWIEPCGGPIHTSVPEPSSTGLCVLCAMGWLMNFLRKVVATRANVSSAKTMVDDGALVQSNEFAIQ